jgi:hypothetical protein
VHRNSKLKNTVLLLRTNKNRHGAPLTLYWLGDKVGRRKKKQQENDFPS